MELAQDEGELFEFGLCLRRKNISWHNEVAGFIAHDAYKYINVSGYNDPFVVRSNLLKQGKRFDYKAECQFGLHDYHYNTFRLSVFYKFAAKIKI